MKAENIFKAADLYAECKAELVERKDQLASDTDTVESHAITATKL